MLCINTGGLIKMVKGSTTGLGGQRFNSSQGYLFSCGQGLESLIKSKKLFSQDSNCQVTSYQWPGFESLIKIKFVLVVKGLSCQGHLLAVARGSNP